MTQDVEQMIEDWHFHGAGEGQELYEYLGWTFDQYAYWALTGELP